MRWRGNNSHCGNVICMEGKILYRLVSGHYNDKDNYYDNSDHTNDDQKVVVW